MMSPEIQEFATNLVRRVRDSAIRNCDALLQGNANSPAAKRWRQTKIPRESMAVVIPDIVDETVFSLLQAIDQGLLRMKFVSSSGKEINLNEHGNGELAGWYMGSGGWRALFSEQCFVDDFTDLAD